MTRDEFRIKLESKGCTVLLVENPVQNIICGNTEVTVLMRSLRTQNVDEVVNFLGKSASIVFLYKVEETVAGTIIRGNYITK
ncbi:hypothetical protein CPT_Muldoon_216 [Serratia phage Muldoon]|uniref:Uncharacterized protein n=1 Tax=Serratia phage Muldoon TaxID=2601678 RepID=A0A5P8PHH7_9CAUD|nr:hypothetical protein HYP94_gp174 [Serratia phage Muldoon]QFR56167.1 hypothetical protein CPT_Muldoon_216 [Serratia phage Muldoon]